MCAETRPATGGLGSKFAHPLGPSAQVGKSRPRYNNNRGRTKRLHPALRLGSADPRDHLPGSQQQIKQGAACALRLAVFVVLLAVCPLHSQTASDFVTVDVFSADSEPDGSPRGWKPLKFRPVQTQTAYFTAAEGDNHFLKAVSSSAGTGLYKPVILNIKDYPILSWRWKAENMLVKADPRVKSKDDIVARLYIAFHFDPAQAGVIERWKYKAAKSRLGDFPPKWALIYIWDNRIPVGEAFDNAFTSKAKMIVVESGPEKMGRWVAEERNIYEDYVKIIGEEPPATDFIAVMTDTDNTREWAEAAYDDIVFKRAPPPAERRSP